MIPAALLLTSSFFFIIESIIFIACSFKDSQNFFMQSLPLCTSCLFPIILNDDIVDAEKPYEIFFITFIVDKFLRLSFLSSIQDLHK